MAILTESFNGFGDSLVAPSDLPNLSDYDCEKHGDVRAFTEAYEDMVGVVEAIAIYDAEGLKMVKEAKASEVTVESLYPVYETGIIDKAKDIFSKIKKFLMDLWAKVKQFFKTAVAFIFSLFMKGKEFVKKYKKELDAAKSKKVQLKNGFEYENLDKMHQEESADIIKPFEDAVKELEKVKVTELNDNASYTFDSDESKNAIEAGFTHAEEILKKAKEDKEDSLDEVRGKLLGTSPIPASQFDEKLFAFFRKGRNEPHEVTWTVGDAMKILESDYTAQAKKKESESNKEFSEMMNRVKSVEGKLQKVGNSNGRIAKRWTDKMIEATQGMSSIFTASQSIFSNYFRKWKDAISSAEAMSKKVCLVAISGKAED